MAALVPAPAMAHGCNDDGPAGGWEVTALPSGLKVLVVLTEGGGALRSHQNDALASSLASPSYGSWANVDGERVIGITFRNFRYADGKLVGTTKIRVRATFNEEFDQFTGPAKTQLLDLNGNVVGTVTGSVDGRRIAVELPD